MRASRVATRACKLTIACAARGNFPTPQPANRCFASVWNGARFPCPESRSFAFRAGRLGVRDDRVGLRPSSPGWPLTKEFPQVLPAPGIGLDSGLPAAP